MKPSILIILTALIIAIAIGGSILQAKHNQTVWNGGYCECGGHWELKGVTKVKNGSITKYYACEKCFEEIEIKA